MYPVRCVFRLVDRASESAAAESVEPQNADTTVDLSNDMNANELNNNSLTQIVCKSVKPSSDACKLMVSAPKKNHKRAVSRNLFKRRLRESFRLNRRELIDQLSVLQNEMKQGELELHISLSYIAKDELDYRRIENAVKKCLEKVAQKISNNAAGRIN